MKILPSELIHRIEQRFRRLYGEERVQRLSARLTQLLSCYDHVEVPATTPWTQQDAILAAFGDSVTSDREKPLQTLRHWLDHHIGDAFSCFHLLPFYPANPGEEYAVCDHRQVDPELGSWEDVSALAQHRRLMVDVLLGRISRDSAWFRDYVDGISPARGYFISLAPDTDLGRVESPCGTPILTCIQTRRGERHLWTSYGCDQFDLDFRNPDVLFEFIDILLSYVDHGARLLRLDGIAWLWKDPHTCSLDLAEDHEIVKLLRDVLTIVAPGVLVAGDNEGFFGNGDECQLLYTRPLGVLLVHALHSGDAGHLHRWLENLPEPPPGCSYIHQSDDANGIHLKAATGHLPDREFDHLVNLLEERGAAITPYRRGDSLLPFEANLSYFDALADPGQPVTERHIARFLCAQTTLMSLRGLPALYLPSLLAAPSDHARVTATGNPRAANRRRWQWQELDNLLKDPGNHETRIFRELLRRLRLRCGHAAFHPDAPQFPLPFDGGLFGVRRTAPDGSETLVAVSNLGHQSQSLIPDDLIPDLIHYPVKQDLISGQRLEGQEDQPLILEPCQCLWLLASCPQPTSS
ncbi:MAG TPA: hypothetical protein ENI90_00955 [Methylothermaceae bacterium]|nr:hypothetical protein [Methylothermaceae bacterium]